VELTDLYCNLFMCKLVSSQPHRSKLALAKLVEQKVVADLLSTRGLDHGSVRGDSLCGMPLEAGAASEKGEA
jgi:hypothetical protein